MKAIQIQDVGQPEVLRWVELEDPAPGEGRVLVKHHAIGLNYIDTYHRSGLYTVPLPVVPGLEAAGEVVKVGAGVTDFQPGDLVAYTDCMGAYAEYAAVPAQRLMPVPEAVGTELAAAAMLQGLTTHYLTESTFPIGQGDTVLIHAAAGGVGLLLVQRAKRKGARVIGTVSTAEKEQLAREAGADEVIRYTEKDFVTEVRALTNEQGCEVVYDGVGRSTFMGSLDCLKRRGMLVSFGQSSGNVEPFAPGLLTQKGSLFLTRPSLMDYVRDPEELRRRSDELFTWLAQGELSVRIDRRLALSEAAEAHRMLEGRKTTGKVLLLP